MAGMAWLPLTLHPITAAGGLPDSWLGGNKVLKTVRYLDLSNNFLGYAGISSANSTSGVVGTGQYATRVDWCHTPTALDLTNEGWCPTATPLTGTLDSLEMFDISNNGFVGEQQAALGVHACALLPRPPSVATPRPAARILLCCCCPPCLAAACLVRARPRLMAEHQAHAAGSAVQASCRPSGPS